MRIGLDGQYLFGSWLFKGEVAYGEDDSKSVIGGLAEIDYTLPDYQNVQLEFQCLSWLGDLDDSDSNDTTLTVGASYKFNQDITLRTAYSHDFNLAGGKEDDKVFIQVYYYGL